MKACIDVLAQSNFDRSHHVNVFACVIRVYMLIYHKYCVPMGEDDFTLAVCFIPCITLVLLPNFVLFCYAAGYVY